MDFQIHLYWRTWINVMVMLPDTKTNVGQSAMSWACSSSHFKTVTLEMTQMKKKMNKLHFPSAVIGSRSEHSFVQHGVIRPCCQNWKNIFISCGKALDGLGDCVIVFSGSPPNQWVGMGKYYQSCNMSKLERIGIFPVWLIGTIHIKAPKS